MTYKNLTQDEVKELKEELGFDDDQIKRIDELNLETLPKLKAFEYYRAIAQWERMEKESQEDGYETKYLFTRMTL